jgi:UDP-N-acetyl-D-glucosamine dehydrogenase
MKKQINYNLLKNKILHKKSTIAVIGLGYVGLPLAISFSYRNFTVIGLDNDLSKIISLNKRISYISSVSSLEVQKSLKKKFIPESDFNYLDKSDIIIVCVPTPIDKNKKPEMKYVNDVVNQISKYNLMNKLIIFECTSYPGTTEEFLNPIINKKALTVGENVFIGYSSEREDPGNKVYSLLKRNIPKVVSGKTKKCLNLVNELYSSITKNTIPVSNIKTAEFTKLLENIYRSVNIGLINEMRLISEKLGINIYEAIEAAKSKPFGFQAFYPGPGVGGHCIPVDPYFLTWKVGKIGLQTKFIHLAGKINDSRPQQITNYIKQYFRKKEKNKLKGLILGLSYKKNSDDIRMSPALKIHDILKKKMNYDMHVHDPCLNKKTKNFLKKINFLNKEQIDSKLLKKINFILILTDHEKIDFKFFQRKTKIIFDTRNVFQKNEYKNVIKI